MAMTWFQHMRNLEAMKPVAVKALTAKDVVKAALLKGELIFDGGCYPSRTVISYSGTDTVTIEGRSFVVEGVPSGGRWYDRMWLDGKDGGVKISEDEVLIYIDRSIPRNVDDTRPI